MRTIPTLALCAALIGGLTGCNNEQAQVALHEPGAYKGQVDPLLAATKGGSKDEVYKKRFVMIQTDR